MAKEKMTLEELDKKIKAAITQYELDNNIIIKNIEVEQNLDYDPPIISLIFQTYSYEFDPIIPISEQRIQRKDY